MTTLQFFWKEFLMDRASNLLSCFFFCLACVLATVATLAVPQNAFADDPWTQCECIPGENECWADCCLNVCGDVECQASCCEAVCKTDKDCLAICAAQIKCPGNTKCDNGCSPRKPGTCATSADHCFAVAKTMCNTCGCETDKLKMTTCECRVP